MNTIPNFQNNFMWIIISNANNNTDLKCMISIKNQAIILIKMKLEKQFSHWEK